MILDEIKADNLSARKIKNKLVSSVLTTLIGEITMVGKNRNRTTTDAETVAVIKKFKKGASENCTLMADSGADSKELETYIEEISIYDTYLPKLMTEDELQKAINQFILEGGNNTGSIMKALKNKYDGKYDGKMASILIKKSL